MPRANPATSFDASVRHLFRHLRDAEQLKRNPLVKRFFGLRFNFNRVYQTGALTAVHTLVDAGAKAYGDTATLDEKPVIERQLAIFYGCIQKRTVAQLSSELGISVRQCYRERAIIYRYVGDFISRHEPRKIIPVASIVSTFHVQMERATLRAENGDYQQAMLEYTSLMSNGDNRQKLEAFAKRVELELELGDLRAATSSLQDLSAVLQAFACELSDSEIKACKAQINLLTARAAFEQGSFELAFAKLSQAREISSCFVGIDDRRLKRLFLDIVLESANREFEVGNFDVSQKFLTLAKDCNSTPSLSGSSTANICLIQAVLNFSTMRPGTFATVHNQVDLINQAQASAAQCGSLKWRLQAEVALLALQRPRENVMEKTEMILTIAQRLRNPRLVATLSVALADLLMETPFWRHSEALARFTLSQDSLDEAMFCILRAAHRLKAGSPAASRRHAWAAYRIAKAAGASRLQCSALRLLAEASHRLGYEEEAADYILSALTLAERNISAAACVKVYQSAALITGRRKYAREAKLLSLCIER